MRNGIIAGGNWIVDHVKLIDTWPAQDTLATIVDQSSSNGGAPYNILIDLAHLGARFPLTGIGLVGDDANGKAIIDDCRAHGVDSTGIRITTAAATSYTDVMTVEKTGRRTFFHQRGANAHLDIEHFDFAGAQAKIFHFGYLLLLDRLDEMTGGQPRACEVLKRAKLAGLRTSLDCVSEDSHRFHTIVTPTLPFVDILFANDFEAEKVTGVPLRANGRIAAAAVGLAARKLLKAGVQSWVVIHFPEAAYACSAAGEGIWQAGLRVPPGDIRGAAGAGDALAAGVLFGLHEEWPMAECLRFGVCAAAASLYHPTCSEGVMPADACLGLGQRLGFQSLPA